MILASGVVFLSGSVVNVALPKIANALNTSLASGLAPTTGWLIGLRALQGISGALMIPESLALIRVVYTDPEARGRAIGTWSGWTGIATVIGPLLGGFLVDTLSWRWAFYIILPMVALTIRA